MKNYLPSKKFIYSIVILVILVVLFFVISNLLSGKNSFFASKEGQLETSNLTISDLVKKDTDSDGVADWEEALWGTDINNKTTFDGTPDGKYIADKRAELKLANGATTDENGLELNETDKFAQDFFASLSAMKQSGQVDSTTINNVSAALGQKIADPTIIDKYTTKDAKISENDGVEQQKAYYGTIKGLFEKYSTEGLGDEVEIVSTLVNSSTTDEKTKYTDQLNQIADAYEAYAQNIVETTVPQSLVTHEISIANSANNTGIAVRNMIGVADDPIVGLSGLSQYQKYSDELIAAVGNLETILYNNGIILE